MNRQDEVAAPRGSTDSEESPLLPRERIVDPKKSHKTRVIAICFLMVFMLEFGSGLVVPNFTAVLEDDMCQQLHPGVDRLGPGDRDICKNPDVQGKLAALRGWQVAFDSFPGIVATIPYGMLSDRWGRKPILALSLFGMNLSIVAAYTVLFFPQTFPVELTLPTSLIMLVGGSPSVAQAMIYSYIADVTDVAGRAPVFFRFMAVKLLAEVVSNPLAGLVVLKSPWLGLMLSLALFILGNLIVLALPATTRIRPELSREAEPDGADGTANGDDAKLSGVGDILRRAGNSVSSAFSYIAANKGTSFLAASLVFIVLGSFVQYLLLQYVTTRYGWSWSKATFLLTIRSICNLVVLLFVLPWASHYCVAHLRAPAMLKDAWIARFSGVASVLGALLIAVAFHPAVLSIGLVVFAAGGGMNSAIRGLLNALVEPRHVGMLNSVLSFMEMVGYMLAGPALSQALRAGIELGGAWIGLPFLCAALIYLVSAAIVFSFQVPRGEVEVAEEEGE